MLGVLERVLLVVLLVILMAGIGATLELSRFESIARRPRSLVVALLAQYLWMPLAAFVLTVALDLEPLLALGLIILGVCTGGTTATVFTYFAGGDVALGVATNLASKFVAVAAVPGLLGLYGATLAPSGLVVPLGSIAGTLAAMLLPLGVGLALRRRRPRYARALERAGAIAGIVIVAVLLVSGSVRNADLFAAIPWQGYVAAGILGPIGMALGYLSAASTRLSPPECIAVMFQTGIQNGPLAMGIAVISFPPETAGIVMRLPMIYALLLVVQATIVTLGARSSARGSRQRAFERR